MKPFESVYQPASGFVTVTFRVPVAAPPESEMLTVSCVELLRVTELTVIPLPEKATDAPLTKPVPVKTMLWFERPWRRELGLSEVIVGRAFTVNPPASEPTPPSRLVTVTVWEPRVAVVVSVMVTVRCVEFVRVTELTVIPVPEKVTDEAGHVPLRKLEPVMTMLWLAAPWPRELGLREETVGPAFTVKAPIAVALPPSVLMTVTFLEPVVASAEIVMLTVRLVELLRVTELTVIEVPEKRTDALVHAPPRKPDPVRVIDWLTAPWPRELGLREEMDGAPVTVRQLVHEALDVPWVTVTFRLPVAAPVDTVTRPLRWVPST